MDIKMISLCLSLLAVAITVSASFDPNGKDSMAKYTLILSKGGKEYDGEIDVDIKKGTEIFHVPKVSSDEEPGDVVYDFKRGLTMIRLSNAKFCFLSNSTDNVPKPADLVQLLEKSNLNGVALERSENSINLTVVGKLEDRSDLSDEMAELCAKLPIYIVAEGDLDPIDVDQTPDTPDEAEDQTPYVEKPAKRVKRGWGKIRIRKPHKWVCKNVCSYKCYKHCNVVCYNVCKKHCNRICKWIG